MQILVRRGQKTPRAENEFPAFRRCYDPAGLLINSTPAAISQIFVENPHNTPKRPAATSHMFSEAEPVRRTPWQRNKALLNTNKSGESG